jgi:hypothetical protein
VIPGVKIYENFIKHLFPHDIDQIHVKKRKKEAKHFEKQKVHRSIHFSFWKAHLKIHLKEPKVRTPLPPIHVNFVSSLVFLLAREVDKVAICTYIPTHKLFVHHDIPMPVIFLTRMTCFSYSCYWAHLSFTIWSSHFREILSIWGEDTCWSHAHSQRNL